MSACLILMGLNLHSFSQPTVNAEALAEARSSGDPFLLNSVLSGDVYRMPSPRYIGHPWMYPSAEPGTISWVGMTYEIESIRYDEVLDEVIVHIPIDNGERILALSSELVRNFSIKGRKFARPDELPDPAAPDLLAEGYHEQAFLGQSIAFLGRHRKELISENRSVTIESTYDDTAVRYAYTRGEYHRISSRRSLLKVMTPHKRAIKQFLKQHRIRFRQATVEELVPVFAHYDQLFPSE